MRNIKLAVGAAFAALVLAAVPTGLASALQDEVVCPEGTGIEKVGNNCKITICHRSAAVNNPYTNPQVDLGAADGDTGNDNGQGDHYAEHKGPIFNSSMQQGDSWGDIIPPIPGSHSGLNWTAEGQAWWNNGCKQPAGGQGGGETPVTTVATTGGRGAGVAVVPQGSVKAGVGGVQSLSTAGLVGLGGSVASLAGGLFWSNRRRLM